LDIAGLLQPTRKDTAAMLEICEQWAVDQEIVSENDILTFSGAALEDERLSGCG
jgi:hypothetical protein